MSESENNDLISVAEAAELLGTTTVNVLMNLKRNLLQGEQIDGEWFVSKASIEGHDGDTKKAVSKPMCQRSTCGSCGQH